MAISEQQSDKLPIVERLHPAPSPEYAFRHLRNKPHCLFLDSSLRHAELGRYSFLAADPFDFVRVRADGSDALAVLHRQLRRFSVPHRPDLPPFQGGAAGLFGYELGRSLERLPVARWDEFQVPALAVGLYDVVLAFDHILDMAWIVSHGFPERDGETRIRRARQRVSEIKHWLADEESGVPKRHRETIDLQAPSVPAGEAGELVSNFGRADYLDCVAAAIEYVRAGDVFQVNLAQRLVHPATDDASSLYLRLRECTPATFAGFFDTGDYQIVSASPERFVRLDGGMVETRPIKGTRQRTARPETNMYAAEDLVSSEKDRAENVMIVDLLRNDLARVCRPDSIQVRQLCGLEEYGYVQHLVSAIRGELAQGNDAFDLIRAVFPGGSVTGAPKVRAMEIITELERAARGAYCGSLGYIGWDGALDLSILIRTITSGGGWWQLPVGGGITSQSDPRKEYEETWHKARGLLRALEEGG